MTNNVMSISAMNEIHTHPAKYTKKIFLFWHVCENVKYEWNSIKSFNSSQEYRILVIIHEN